MPKKPVFVVVFECYISGRLARVEIPTMADPINSRQVRRDCENIARRSFVELAKMVSVKADDLKLKAVDCIEVPEPDNLDELVARSDARFNN